MNTTSTVPLFDLRSLARSKDIFMAAVLLATIGMMLIPMPPLAIDFLIVANLAISLGVILLTLYIVQPMDFSVFPSLLLLITLFRLGLNIAISRSILLQGNAGQLISTFGSMVMGGNYVVGVVVFLMLMIIQFVVITSGAGRVAEVAARFTLDAMPGKQLSIDADLNAGLIDDVQARLRRRATQTEADFYGAMDGASKFVRGDAIATVIVMVVNIIGGFVIGVVQRGVPFMEALQTYTILTVGAGLAVQIPALIISTAAGLIVTRSSSETTLGSLIAGQLANFNVMLTGTIIMAILALIPGLPKLPFLLVGGIFGGLTYTSWRAGQKPPEEPAVVASTEPETPQDMLQMSVVDPMELEVGYGLIPLIDEDQTDNLLHRITAIRRQIMSEMGMILPIVRVRDNLRLQPQAYRMKIRGEEVARGELMLDRYLAIPGSEVDGKLTGIATTEPAFGLPALWISEAEKGRAEIMGYTVVNPLSVLGTHLLEVVRNNSQELLSRQMVKEMLDQLASKVPAAVDGIVPEQISLAEIQSVLRHLLHERVPIRDLAGIIEVVANNIVVTRDPNILAEAVRQNMARTLSNQYRDENGYLHVFTLAPTLEATLRQALSSNENGLNFQLDAGLAQSIVTRTGEQMERMAQAGYFPLLLCPRELRLAFRRLIETALPNLVVLAFSEISPGTRVKAHGMVEQI
jgi:flagellar biosynthesis protein FlhA